MAQTKFYGKYRGTVTNNVDPLMLGRVQVECPAVFGDGRQNWAMPCTPYAGDGVGLFLVPPNDASVWVEFEGGDPRTPIVGGCFWEVGQVPAGDRRQVRAELHGHQLRSPLRQRDAQLTRAAADLQHPHPRDEMGGGDDVVDDRLGIARPVAPVVSGGGVEGLPAAATRCVTHIQKHG